MDWKEIEIDKQTPSAIYRCEANGICLTLIPPYKSDPWYMRLRTTEGHIIRKDSFRLRGTERTGNKETWESMDDLDLAKEKAFELVNNFIDEHLAYWNRLAEILQAMRQ